MTGGTDTSQTYTQGLRQWTVECSGVYPGSAPKTGYEAVLTYGSGYVLHLQTWTLTGSVAVQNITSKEDGGAGWMLFRPGLWNWTLSWTALVDDTTAVADLTAPGASPGAETVNLTNTTNDTLTGSLRTTSANLALDRAGRTEISYQGQFNGPLTAGAANGIFASGGIGTPDWDTNDDGTPDVALSFASAASRTHSGNGFLSGVTITNPLDAAIEVQATFQGTGALTNA